MPTYTPQPLYGGAIQGIIPQGWIDASTLREIPDHQELYLSPTTLSSLIIELNQPVPNPVAQATLRAHPALLSETSPQDQESLNRAAALHHLLDICDPADTLAIVQPPTRVALEKFQGDVAGYVGRVSFTSPVRGGRGQRVVGAGAGAGAAGAGSSGDQAGTTTTTQCWFLLVRLVEQETDLLVLVNVPEKEFVERGDAEGLRREVEVGEGVVAELVRGLEVVEWGLFA
ncbi:Ran GTPase-binding protein MOG1 [Aspergillus brunneoviolaceus CBS 621.78]|uniref:Mog1p/PsbP-like protein n=1 Tax=Aspergillus brunneoviolaceus CBS 621.78 TaxID=1450534 RepID=A0ACD1GA29_9EURO|nr:Mog1p/PsbP-like protein [Aspergillus brunneoviolaceus CBS 621.78]RAH46060.1 Mog1p/PsbP-like protein [Aspergillus brunneoviolaceus CBS 621.78]